MESLSPSLLDLPISFFEYDYKRNSFANVPSQRTTLRRMATTRYYQKPTETIRSEVEKVKQDELKKYQPAFTPVALLNHRKANTTNQEKILQQWPLLMGDIDKKDNPDIDMAELKAHIARLPYILLCAYSVRCGLWFVVRLPDDQTPETLKAHFRHLQRLFNDKFGIVLDSTKGVNATDLRFVSYDPAPYLNEDPTIMAGIYTPPPPQPRPVAYSRPFEEDAGKLVARLVRFTESAGEGERHSTLLRAAKLAGGFVAAGRMDEQTAVYALETVASEWPTFDKSQKTIRDGIRYGLTAPVFAEERHFDQPAFNSTNGPKPSLEKQRVDAPVIETETQKKVVTRLAEWGPGIVLKPTEDQLEREPEPETLGDYPAELDEPNAPDAVPTIRQRTVKDYFAWQCSPESPFSQLGLASLSPKQP